METILKKVAKVFVFGVLMAGYEAINAGIANYGVKKESKIIATISKGLKIFGQGLNGYKYAVI